MTNYKGKHIGRPMGSTWDKNVPRAAYPEIVRRFDSGQEIVSDIGRDYCVGPAAIRSLVKRYKAARAMPRGEYGNEIYPHGGLITHGSNVALERKDRAEVDAFMKANPGCSAMDIAMCCHMGHDQALRLRKIVEGHEKA